MPDPLRYLDQLPPEARRPGRAADGEIELLADPAEVEAVVRERREGALPAPAPDPDGVGVVFRDEYVTVVRDPVRFPGGERGTYLRIFEASGLDGPVGVALLPVRDGRVYLRRAFRHATRQWELECPRGFRPAGASAEEAARHEAEEELGIAVEAVEELGAVYANTGLLAGGARAFVVRLADAPSERTHEPHEALGEVVALTPAQLMEAIALGEVRDGFTLSAVAMAIARGHLSPQAAFAARGGPREEGKR